jgi:hypothetical protein
MYALCNQHALTAAATPYHTIPTLADHTNSATPYQPWQTIPTLADHTNPATLPAQSGVKMTNEPPQGIRANMRRSYCLEPVASDSFFESCAQPAAFKRLLLGLVYFHAVVQVSHVCSDWWLGGAAVRCASASVPCWWWLHWLNCVYFLTMVQVGAAASNHGM